jgi:endonuclease/exonuclease/phosphatase family metal-dependent hydrolase
MAGRFSTTQWDQIEAELAANSKRYGMPDGPREESMLLASFNIRKLGSTRNRQRELAFMARFCARCDLVAIREVQDNLDGLLRLKALVDERVSSTGEFELLVSDITGEVPGESGMAERLAFMYRKSRVKRMDVTSDIAIDRTGVIENFTQNEAEITQAWDAYQKKNLAFQAGSRKTKPTFTLPAFLTFTRTPYVAAFEVPAAGNTKPLQFIAVNAHLLYGTPIERKAEFKALMRWMTMRLKSEKRMIAPNFVLLGDLNLDFDKPIKDREEIEAYIKGLNREVFGTDDASRIYFPFIDKHPLTNREIRTNARQNQTFDQIAFLRGEKEKRLPSHLERNSIDRSQPDGFDFGVFNFAELFARVIKGKAYHSLTKTEREGLGRHFEYSVSDHMPIWVRLTRPGF